MATVLYTSTEAVRAVFGLTANEIEDFQFTDLQLAMQLELALDEVYSDHATVKTAIDDNTATAEQQKLWKLIQLYCQYEAAVLMLPGYQNFVAQKITDGDVEMQRFVKDNVEDTIQRIMAARDKYRGLLNPDDFGSSTGALFTHFSTVSPSYDPVTNE